MTVYPPFTPLSPVYPSFPSYTHSFPYPAQNSSGPEEHNYYPSTIAPPFTPSTPSPLPQYSNLPRTLPSPYTHYQPPDHQRQSYAFDPTLTLTPALTVSPGTTSIFSPESLEQLKRRVMVEYQQELEVETAHASGAYRQNKEDGCMPSHGSGTVGSVPGWRGSVTAPASPIMGTYQHHRRISTPNIPDNHWNLVCHLPPIHPYPSNTTYTQPLPFILPLQQPYRPPIHLPTQVPLTSVCDSYTIDPNTVRFASDNGSNYHSRHNSLDLHYQRPDQFNYQQYVPNPLNTSYQHQGTPQVFDGYTTSNPSPTYPSYTPQALLSPYTPLTPHTPLTSATPSTWTTASSIPSTVYDESQCPLQPPPTGCTDTASSRDRRDSCMTHESGLTGRTEDGVSVIDPEGLAEIEMPTDQVRVEEAALKEEVLHEGELPGFVYTDNADIKQTRWIRRWCFNCRTSDSPSWRRSQIAMGRILCNKCGIFERTHQSQRPLHTENTRVKPLDEDAPYIPPQTQERKRKSGGYKSRPPQPLKLVSDTTRGNSPARVTSRSAASSYQSPFTSTALPDRREPTTSSGSPLSHTPLYTSTPNLASIPSTPAPTAPTQSPGHRRASSAQQSRRHAPYTTTSRRATYAHAYSAALRTKTTSDLRPSYDGSSSESSAEQQRGQGQRQEDGDGVSGEYVATWMTK